MALNLEELLSILDSYDIDHESESAIRRKLRKRSDVKTTASQFFLKSAAVSHEMDRKNYESKSCVLIPRGDVPSEFFELLDNKIEGMVLIVHNDSGTMCMYLLIETISLFSTLIEGEKKNDSGFQDMLDSDIEIEISDESSSGNLVDQRGTTPHPGSHEKSSGNSVDQRGTTPHPGSHEKRKRPLKVIQLPAVPPPAKRLRVSKRVEQKRSCTSSRIDPNRCGICARFVRIFQREGRDIRRCYCVSTGCKDILHL